MHEPIIAIAGLTKRYGTLTAVDHLDLQIRKGEVFGLLGPNGAGKSTTILMMLGLTEPAAGSVKVCGIDPVTHPIDVKRKVGYLPDEVGFYGNRSGLENLLFTARLNSMTEKEALHRAELLLKRTGLHDVKDRKTRTYSRGMRQRLGLADVLIKNPEIIILDEPTLGIDPKGVREFLDLIVQLSREEQITVLLSSHHLHQVQQVCDRVGIFVSGKLLAEGDIPALSAQLFGTSPYLIEAGISVSINNTAEPEEASVAQLQEALSAVNGVDSVQYQNGTLSTTCSRDISSLIASMVIGKGFGLTFLRRKEYGLDDIYNRYFEQRNVYEQTA